METGQVVAGTQHLAGTKVSLFVIAIYRIESTFTGSSLRHGDHVLCGLHFTFTLLQLCDEQGDLVEDTRSECERQRSLQCEPQLVGALSYLPPDCGALFCTDTGNKSQF